MQYEKDKSYTQEMMSDLHPCGILILARSIRNARTKSWYYPKQSESKEIHVGCLYINPMTDNIYTLEERILESDACDSIQCELVSDMLIKASQRIGKSFNTVILDKWSAKPEALQLIHRFKKNY